MKLQDIANTIGAKFICGSRHSSLEIFDAFASDLMSDVLTLGNHNPALITGLSNLQTIRTAEMADIRLIVLARGKKASPEMIALAEENEIAILETPFSVFKTCGILYQHGIKPIF
jgi:serine kinase of HPr protein (carbohydrate metabolism regulator)